MKWEEKKKIHPLNNNIIHPSSDCKTDHQSLYHFCPKFVQNKCKGVSSSNQMISLKAQYPDNQISLLEAQQTQALVSLRTMLTVMRALDHEINHKIYVPEVQCQLPVSHSRHDAKN
jgi:hypothetical protein